MTKQEKDTNVSCSKVEEGEYDLKYLTPPQKLKCRACLRQSDIENDFEIIAIDCFTDLTRIEINEEDGYTKMICIKCNALLSSFRSFKQICLKSDAYLRELGDQAKHCSAVVKEEGNLPIHNEFVICELASCSDINPESMTPKDTNGVKSEDDDEEDLNEVMSSDNEKKEHSYRKKTKSSDKAEEKKMNFKKMFAENGFVVCPYCPKKFVKINTFYKHKRDHFQTYMCSLCGKQYSSQRSLTIHYSFLHTDERKFKCDLCGSSFKAKASLIDHMDTRHGSTRNYVCDRCSSSFKSKKSLGAHIRLVHSGLEAKFQCSQCDKKFKKRSYLITHEQLHTGHKLYSCDICYKSFTTKNSRDRHQEKHQTYDWRPFQCHLCFQVFKKEKYHRRHLRNFHPEEVNAKALRLPLEEGNNVEGADDTVTIKTETGIS